MKTCHTLALKELGAQKVMSFLILAAVILSATMTAAVGQSLGILKAMRGQQAIAIGGNRYATFVQLSEGQAKVLKEDPRLSYVGLNINVGSMELNGILKLALVEYVDGSWEAYPSYTSLKEGRLPENPMEIALPEDALGLLGFQGGIGDTLTLSASKAMRHDTAVSSWEFTEQFILTGITESNYLGYTAGGIQGIVGEGTAEKILPPSHMAYNADIRTVRKKAFQEVMDDLSSLLGMHPLDVLYNQVYLNALGISFDGESDGGGTVSDAGFPYIVAAGILAGALILLAAGLVIYNILKIYVTKSIGQFGILRAMGGEKGQLYLLVAEQILLLCLPGIPAGMLLGYFSAQGILTAALGQFSPEVFLASDRAGLEALIAQNSSGKGWYLVLGAGITLLFAFAAAVPAAGFAARVSPVTAISGQEVKIRRKKGRRRRVRNFEAYYARLNMKRNPSRTVVTVLSLVMSITVFITLQGFLSLITVTDSYSEHLGDYEVVNEVIGFTPGQVGQIRENENIDAVAAMQFSLYERDYGRGDGEYPLGISIDFPLQPGEHFQLVGLNPVYGRYFLEERLSDEELVMFEDGQGCVVRNPVPLLLDGEEIPRTEVKQGSFITVSGKRLRVLKTMDGYDGYFSVGNNGFVNGVQAIVSDSLYGKLAGKEEYAQLHLILREGAVREEVDDFLEGLCREIPGSTCLSYEMTDQQLKESGEQITFLAWGLILFIGLIGILNIINTVYTNIHTRVKEIGIQRAVGMSAGSLRRTFLWEGAYYGMYAALFGCVAGYFCNLLVEAAVAGALDPASVPWVPMAEAAGVSVAACLAASDIPLRRVSGMEIVEAIETI